MRPTFYLIKSLKTKRFYVIVFDTECFHEKAGLTRLDRN